MEEQILRAAESRAVQGALACADAHAIAGMFDISPEEVGRIINRLTSLRFYHCQLGLFGYGPKAEGRSKIVLKAVNLPEEIVEAVQGASQGGRISCRAVWEIAGRFAYPRLGIANILEALGIKVSPCQLGCF